MNPDPRETRTRGHWAVSLALAVWAVTALVVGGYLMSSHLISLPLPSESVKNNALDRAVAALRKPADRGRWLAVHIVLDSCGCSEKVLEHLIVRGPRTQTAEQVLLVLGDEGASDGTLTARLKARGFPVESMTADALSSRFYVEAAPMLVVLSPDDHVAYLGGYTDRKQAPGIRDSEILDRLARGETVKPLPLFGCAVSKQLQSSLDPLGLKN